MDKLIKAYSKEVETGWQKQYEQQAKVLIWPPFVHDDAEYHAIVDKMRPIEIIKPREAIANELPGDLRQFYRNYIEGDLPKLATKIGAEWKASSTGIDPSATTPVVGPDGQPRVAEDKSIVYWTPDNQQQILTTHFGFAAKAEVPATLEVLYAQEDLWVLQNLMDIIQATNGPDVTARHEAAIKQIDYVRIGLTAMGLSGAVTKIGTTMPARFRPKGCPCRREKACLRPRRSPAWRACRAAPRPRAILPGAGTSIRTTSNSIPLACGTRSPRSIRPMPCWLSPSGCRCGCGSGSTSGSCTCC